MEFYRYHTFCITKFGAVAYIIDITRPKRIIPLDEFILDIMQLNSGINGYKFVIMSGDGSDLSMQMKLNRSCQSLKSFSYKHSKERIKGYTYIPELKKYLVIYNISENDKLITFSVVDPEQGYDRTEVLK